jgi:hypothetical protein
LVKSERRWIIEAAMTSGIPEQLRLRSNGSMDDRHSKHGLRVVAVDLRKDTRWEAFLGTHPDAVIYQHPGWLRALEHEYGRECIALACEDRAGELRGILPLMATCGLPGNLGGHRAGRRLSSLPRTPIAGPLATDPEATGTLLHAAVERARMDASLQLELKPCRELPQTDGLVRVPWRQTFVLTLPDDPEKLRFGNSRNHSRIRWSINKATRLGVEVRSAEDERDLKGWYELYLEAMRWNAVPPRSYRFFAALWRELHAVGAMRVLLAEHRGAGRTELLAGSIILSYGHTAFYAFNGSRRNTLPLRPNDIIQWHAIHDACRHGLRWYDLGEVGDDHEMLADFKSKWGAEPQRLYRYYYRDHPRADGDISPNDGDTHRNVLLQSAARGLWKRLPLRITETLGDWIYARL